MADRPLISIVDDDRSFRDSLRRLLESFDYEARVFASAGDFLASAERGQTDCLIADINMPEMTGVELHRHLKDAGVPIPTILITAYPEEAVRLRAEKEGVAFYLRKPCEESDLLRCLRSVLAARKSAP